MGRQWITIDRIATYQGEIWSYPDSDGSDRPIKTATLESLEILSYRVFRGVLECLR